MNSIAFVVTLRCPRLDQRRASAWMRDRQPERKNPCQCSLSRKGYSGEPLSAPRRPERWREATHPGSVPSDGPAVARGCVKARETGPLNAASAIKRSGRLHHTVAASPYEHASVLSEHRGDDGGGKNKGSAEPLDLGHWFLRIAIGRKPIPGREVPAFKRTCFPRFPRLQGNE
jgi:hypothetical protein